LVLHDWGAAFGLWHALHHPQDVKGLALFEPLLSTSRWDDYEGERRKRFEMFRDRTVNHDLIQVKNLFVEQIPNGVRRKERMTEEVMNRYREPFPTVESRKAIRRFPEMLPIGEDSETYRQFKEIEEALPRIRVPVLLLTVTPGAIVTETKLRLMKERIHDLEITNLGPGLHHFHEDYPIEMAAAIREWMTSHAI
jgi:haloalkane dehalogenase